MSADDLRAMNAYVAALPHGLDSYPECQAKAALLRSMLELLPRELDTVGMPEALVALVRDPPPVSSWVPEVHFRAVMHGVRDRLFASDDALVTFTYDAQRELFSGPVYRIMMAVVSPEKVVRGAGARWGHFHTGSTLDIVTSHANGADAQLTTPPYLTNHVDHLATLAGIRAAIELAGARRARCSVLEESPTGARFELAWE